MSETAAERETGARETETVSPDQAGVPPRSRWRPIPRSIFNKPHRTGSVVAAAIPSSRRSRMAQTFDTFSTRYLSRTNRRPAGPGARRRIGRTIGMLVMALLLLLLLAAATGRANIISVVGWGGASNLPERITSTSGSSVSSASESAVVPITVQEVAPLFRDYYEQCGGARIFGPAISPLLRADGRNIQWFERGRLEEWQENSGSPYQILGSRLGAEYTSGVRFSTSAPFESVVGARYFPETSQGVREPFLSFWEQNGALTVFGLPIGPEVQEQVAPGQILTVQYFERARLEYRPAIGSGSASVTIGPLGQILYQRSAARPVFPAQAGVSTTP